MADLRKIVSDPRPALRAERQRLGLTYQEIAQCAGLSAPAICRTLNGRQSITEINLSRIAAALTKRQPSPPAPSTPI